MSRRFGPEKNVLNAVNNELIDFNSDDMHAEEAVLTRFSKTEFSTIIKEIDLVVIRTNKLDQLRISKPCCRCVNFMKDFTLKHNIKINKICYSINDSLEIITFEELITSPTQHVPKGMRGLLHYEKSVKA